MESCSEYRNRLVAEWKEINAETLQFNEDDFRCPTCHRPFEPDEIETKQQEMTQRFNARKANKLEENRKVGKANTERMHELEASIKETEKDIAAKTEELENMRHYAACSAAPVCPDATPAIEADAAWQNLSQQIASLEAETQKPVEIANNADLKEQCRQIDNEIYSLNAILANKDIIERNNARIAELEKQLRTQSEELARLEGIEFTIAEFTKARIEAVDKRINGMFSLVKFRMYEKQINGGEVETCVATVDGIPYSDLNDAKKVNAGLDIINAICKFEGITAPIFIDNAESVQQQFKNALGEHKDAFVASLIDLYNGDKSLQTCNTNALICEALRAATLRLPLNKALGFAYIVVYNNSVKRVDDNGNDVLDPQTHKPIYDKVPTPTFIPGYKGYIQLAMRTGQYKTINADFVYEGELRKVNKLTGEIAFDGEKKSDRIVGYFCYFELLNGFSKTLYVSVEDMAKYAKHYSPSIGYKTTIEQLIAKANDGIVAKKVGWEGNFNDMALKTVIRRLLSKYGYLSVEMQNAISGDMEGADFADRNIMIADNANKASIPDNVPYENVDTETGEIMQMKAEGNAAAPTNDAPDY